MIDTFIDAVSDYTQPSTIAGLAIALYGDHAYIKSCQYSTIAQKYMIIVEPKKFEYTIQTNLNIPRITSPPSVIGRAVVTSANHSLAVQLPAQKIFFSQSPPNPLAERVNLKMMKWKEIPKPNRKFCSNGRGTISNWLLICW